MLCALCVGQASALEYTMEAPDDYLFGRPTSDDTIYEDSRGMFEMMNGHQLMRYLLADQFHAIRWEIVPGTCYERAVLLPIDRTTPAYRAFEQKLYTAILQNYHLNPQKQHDRKEHDTR